MLISKFYDEYAKKGFENKEQDKAWEILEDVLSNKEFCAVEEMLTRAIDRESEAAFSAGFKTAMCLLTEVFCNE